MSFPQLENYAGTYFEEEKVFHLRITGKTMTQQFFDDLKASFDAIEKLDVRCVMLTSDCKHFSTGLDLNVAMELIREEDADAGRVAIENIRMLQNWQGALERIQSCPVPVITGVDNLCIGGGIDLICNADIRVCTKSSKFTIKEVDIGLCADLGTTQKFPLVCNNDSKIRELMYTGRYFNWQEAQEIGFVSNVYENKQEMLEKMKVLAVEIAGKSPVAVYTIKNVMNHQQAQQYQSTLRYQQAINGGMLQSMDLKVAGMASVSKQKPVFPKL